LKPEEILSPHMLGPLFSNLFESPYIQYAHSFHGFFAEPPRIVPFSFGSEVVDEGAFAQLTCSVSHGDEPISLSWSLKGDEISSEPTMTTSTIGTRTSILIISAVGSRHVGEYTCQARNPAGVATYSTLLRVNGGRELQREGRNWKVLALDLH
jgi:hypothetical protein